MAIIGVLAAIALPILTSQRIKAQDADAKSNARNIRIHIESCAVAPDNTYADCATAAQIQSGGLPVGTLWLPSLNQYASSSGTDSNDNNGVKNGAQCIVQSNGVRSCEQTTPTTSGTTDTTTGGVAPGVGDCVEGGVVEAGCAGIVSATSGYTITAVSKSLDVFQIVNNDSHVTRPCDPPGTGGCPSVGEW